ncbi:MAG: pilus assembly FimT family protein [Anaerohalosphaeraceae bacterium]
MTQRHIRKTSINGRPKTGGGFVLIEMLMVVGLIGLMAVVATISFSAMWGNLRFKRQAEELVGIFQMAYNAAAQSDRRYAVILDFTEQAFILREFKSLDLETMDPDEAIIQTGFFTEALTLDYVVYDDLEDTRDFENATEARFLAGKSGWQYGGKVVLLDENGMVWTLVIHRLARPVELFKGDVAIDPPQEAIDVPF